MPVPRGKDVGGAFQHIPLCRSMTQTGCVVAYASFRSNEPPPKGALFGHVAGGEGMMAACVNPAAPAGGSAMLHAYLASGVGGATTLRAATGTKPMGHGLLPKKPIRNAVRQRTRIAEAAECVDNEHGSYLAITVHGDPNDPRVDDIAGDVVANGA